MALTLIDRDDPAARAFASGVASESAGNPLFVHELVRFTLDRLARADANGGDISSELPHLEEVILARVRTLPSAARSVLEVLAVAARPVERAVFVAAAAVPGPDRDAAISALTAATLVRTRVGARELHLEPYHDRIRETVAASLSADRAVAIHARLAAALEATGRADPEQLAAHYEAAGDRNRAFQQAVAAARRAAATLAFGRSARLLRTAIALDTERACEHRLHRDLGLALANGGRGRESAQAYRVAAALAEPAEAIELRALASEQLLRSGYIEEGFESVAEQLVVVGTTMREPNLWTLVTTLWRLARNRLRGLGFTPRTEAEVPRELLFRVDVLGSVSDALGIISPPQAMSFQAWHLPAALDAGEPARIARALGIEQARMAAFGIGAAKRVAELRRVQERAAEIDDSGYSRCALRLTAAMTSVYSGSWFEGYSGCVDAEAYVLEAKGVLAFEFRLLWLGQGMCLWRLGRWAELCDYIPVILERVRERDDLYIQTITRSFTGHIEDLRAGRPEEGLAALDEVLAAWPNTIFQVPHFARLCSVGEVLLYMGRGTEVNALLAEAWPQIKRSFFLQAQLMHVMAYSLRGRATLAEALVEPQGSRPRKRLLARATRDFRQTIKRPGAWPRGTSALELAAVAHARGDGEGAIRLLGDAITLLDETGMSLHAAVARLARGRLVGGSTGAEQANVALAVMRQEGIAEPDRLVEMWAPGLGVVCLDRLAITA